MNEKKSNVGFKLILCENLNCIKRENKLILTNSNVEES